jgi:uncharacterized repeat protein (TIGR03803 family)
MRDLRLGRMLPLMAAGLVVAALAPLDEAAAAVLTGLHRFCHEGPPCIDGTNPAGGLLMDAAGNLFGTTSAGGAANGGTVFELSADANKVPRRQTVLYSFCAKRNCTDGRSPRSALIMDAAGNLYGTTNSGGAQEGAGAVFELAPDPATGTWAEKVLYSFCAQGGCPDGAFPSGLIMDGAGNLYGTTEGIGGGAYAWGTVFELTPGAATGTWKMKVVHNFCVQVPTCPDGGDPRAGLFMDTGGNLYGTTLSGGAHFAGTVFELTPDTATGTWTETVLYSFCAQGHFPNCTDGYFPQSDLIMDAAGNLYGTTVEGNGPRNRGTVFELTPDTSAGTWTETVLYRFCAQGKFPHCTDGDDPGGLIMDAAGNLYGTTQFGGAGGSPDKNGFAGTVFELSPGTAKSRWREKVLHSFCSQQNCTDGAGPEAGLILDAGDDLYGATLFGGSRRRRSGSPGGWGTVFELKR